jgi:hypothetical protein
MSARTFSWRSSALVSEKGRGFLLSLFYGRYKIVRLRGRPPSYLNSWELTTNWRWQYRLLTGRFSSGKRFRRFKRHDLCGAA